ELKADIGKLAEPLFDLSERFLRERGNFLPHGAVLTENGTVELVSLAPEGTASAPTILPQLHSALRSMAKERSILAVAVAENVKVTPEGKPATDAIKVLFEHQRGLTVALYLPFAKRFLRGFKLGSTFAVAASPEVKAW